MFDSPWLAYTWISGCQLITRFRILIVSGVQICKQRLQTASALGDEFTQTSTGDSLLDPTGGTSVNPSPDALDYCGPQMKIYILAPLFAILSAPLTALPHGENMKNPPLTTTWASASLNPKDFEKSITCDVIMTSLWLITGHAPEGSKRAA